MIQAPVREIVAILGGDRYRRHVQLECGHKVWIKYGARVACTQCAEAQRDAAKRE